MNASVETAVAAEPSPRSAPVTLRGTARGLEIVVHPEASTDEIAELLEAKLAQSPGFFAGSDVVVRCDQPLPMGALAQLEQIAHRMELRIAEIGPAPKQRKPRRSKSKRAKGTEPPVEVAAVPEAAPAPVEAAPAPVEAPPLPPPPDLEETLASLEAESAADGPRLVIGPVRSGTILDATGHMIVVGDVNPGAELRASGSIIVLGALRGVAHAGRDGEAAFIFALKLGPQQLRIGPLITRAGESDDEIGAPEIAYAAGNQIIVEHYRNKLPGGLSAAAL